jgi:hypothetical protein
MLKWCTFLFCFGFVALGIKSRPCACYTITRPLSYTLAMRWYFRHTGLNVIKTDFSYFILLYWRGWGAVLEFEHKASCLLGRLSTTWTMPSALSWASYFSGWISRFLPWPASDLNPPTYSLSYSWEQRGQTPHPAYLLRWGVSLTFLPGWPQTTILLIFASCVAGITGVGPLHPPAHKSGFKIQLGHPGNSLNIY